MLQRPRVMVARLEHRKCVCEVALDRFFQIEHPSSQKF